MDDGGLVGDSGNKAITLLEKRSFVCRARQGRPAPGGPPLMHEVKKAGGSRGGIVKVHKKPWLSLANQPCLLREELGTNLICTLYRIE